MTTYRGYDHSFHTVGILGSSPDDYVLGGDDMTWGDDARVLFEIDLLRPGGDTSGKSVLHMNSKTLEFNDQKVDYVDLVRFIRDGSAISLSDDQTDGLLWIITDTNFGEDMFEPSGVDGDEWALSDLIERLGSDPAGRLLIHSNTRYDCVTSLSATEGAVWEDETDPDDDAQRLAIFRG